MTNIIIINLLNGLSYAALLFLLSAGMSVIQGLMGILNLAHGAMFMVGAYIGIMLATHGWNFGAVLVLGGLSAALVGLVMERGFLKRLHKQENAQVLLTLGFVYIISNVIQWIWGGAPGVPLVPDFLAGGINIGLVTYPVYRLYMIIVGVAVAVILWWVTEKTRVGAIVRAGTDDREMISGMGINLGLVFMAVFFLGAFLAGFAGSMGITILGSYLNIGWDVLFLALAVIVVGGMGSMMGALLASIVIGVIDTFGKAFFPNFALFTIYILFIIVLLVKPSGLLGKRV